MTTLQGVGLSDPTNTRTVAAFPADSKDRVIERIAISGIPSSTCKLYVGAITQAGFRDGSATGVQDIAEYPLGLDVPRGNAFFLVWNSAAVTTQCLGFVQISDR